MGDCKRRRTISARWGWAVGICFWALAVPACSSDNSGSTPDSGTSSTPDGGGLPDSTTGTDGAIGVDAGTGTDAGSTLDSTSPDSGNADAGSEGGASTDSSTDASVGDGSSCPNSVTDSGNCLYDLALQFSGVMNGGANPWSYGETTTPGGSFVPFTINGDAG